ncbi:Exopolygalacturonase A 2 [Colletotrichum truncatum]|uniref:Exopolygalacturonase A 2 n=1 Tax=Colletotrichum truncatum TaxID=5467 RepID=A0ACC3ZCW9_COLTU|nr:Exopolygalacturonase A 2 [Colletotrichum truncatum]KAF6797922.1 Exopolygalacturonase A 2 [Colletotrichum truncatum]
MQFFAVFNFIIASALAACQPNLPPFPNISASPKSPIDFQLPAGPNRDKVCVVKANQDDAGPAILSAARDCNKGGTVYLPNGTYTIKSTLDLTFLDHVDFAIFGKIYFKGDPKHWPGKTFNYPFQSVSLFWRFGGSDVNIYGGGQGIIDGLGQAYWDAMVLDKNVLRPTLFGTDGLHRSTITGLKMRNSPGWFNFISNSSNILVSDISLDVEQKNKSAPAKNTDGWDTYRNCVSFKPNSTSVVVQGLDCTGSHGISVGSLGQYRDQVDIVEDVYIYNITMSKASDGARIKVWPGLPPGSDPAASGGGSGWVRNVTYELFHNVGNDHAISISQCYYTKNQTICDLYPASLKIQDITFLDFSGTTSSKYAPRVGEIICSSPTVCTGIVARNINVKPAGGQPAFFGCHNFDQSNAKINCKEPGP